VAGRRKIEFLPSAARELEGHVQRLRSAGTNSHVPMTVNATKSATVTPTESQAGWSTVKASVDANVVVRKTPRGRLRWAKACSTL